MIVCSRCGFENEDSDTFCGSCASFLEWEGTKVSQEEPPAPVEPEPEPEGESRTGIIERVKEVIGFGDAAAGSAGSGATEVEPSAQPEGEEVEPEVVLATPGAVSAPVVGGGLSGVAGTAATPVVGGSTTAPEGVASPAEVALDENDVATAGALATEGVTEPAPTAGLGHAAGPGEAAGQDEAAGQGAAAGLGAAAGADRAPAERSLAATGASTTAVSAATATSASPLTAPPGNPPAPPISTVPSAPVPSAPASSAPVARTAGPVTGPSGPASGLASPTAGGLSARGGQQRTTSVPGPFAPTSPAQLSQAKVGPTQPTGASGGSAAPAPSGPSTGPVAPTAVQPQAVKPSATRTRPPAKKAAPAREINPGDKVCGQCGEGNDPIRRFCRRCGASLVEATVFKLPWYKALWRRLTHRKQRQAGDRPKMRRRAFGGAGGWVGRLVAGIVVLAVLVLVVLSLVGPAHKHLRKTESRYYHDVIGVVHPTYNPLFARDASASSSAPGHPASNLISGQKNDSWQSNGKTTGQFVVVNFAQAGNVAKVGFDIGDQDTPQAFQTEPRPSKLKLVFGGPHHEQKTVNLRDVPGFQTFTVSTKDVTGVTIFVEGVYPATGPGQNVSIAQVEFFTKS